MVEIQDNQHHAQSEDWPKLIAGQFLLQLSMLNDRQIWWILVKLYFLLKIEVEADRHWVEDNLNDIDDDQADQSASIKIVAKFFEYLLIVF